METSVHRAGECAFRASNASLLNRSNSGSMIDGDLRRDTKRSSISSNTSQTRRGAAALRCGKGVASGLSWKAAAEGDRIAHHAAWISSTGSNGANIRTAVRAMVTGIRLRRVRMRTGAMRITM